MELFRQSFNTHRKLVKHLQECGVLNTPQIIQALLKTDRADFVPSERRDRAYGDYPLPIGEGQTISQPSTVALMLEMLSPKKGQKILDVGCGSGWTTALLSRMVGEEGVVYGLEIKPSLVEFGRSNLKEANIENAEILQAKKHVLGLPKQAPFDRILVSAAAEQKIPEELIEQMAKGAIMVIPVGGSIFKVVKTEDGEVEQEERMGFRFVPLIH